MRHHRLLTGFAAALLLLLPSTSLAAEQVLRLTPENTQVTFTLGATGHTVEGTLYLSHGEIRFDPETGQAAGEVAIDARRSESGNKRRDDTMRGKVLEAASHPFIVFVPKALRGKIAESGRSEVEFLGTLTLLGQEHPFTLPATVEIIDGQVKASSTFTVPYIRWGLHDPSFLFLRVDKEVEVQITTTGSLDTTAAID